MADKIRIIIEAYDAHEKIIEGRKIESDNSSKRFREKGVSIDEFKKILRGKWGNDVEIINNAKRQRDVPGEGKEEFGKVKDERFNLKDIREVMKNKYIE